MIRIKQQYDYYVSQHKKLITEISNSIQKSEIHRQNIITFIYGYKNWIQKTIDVNFEKLIELQETNEKVNSIKIISLKNHVNQIIRYNRQLLRLKKTLEEFKYVLSYKEYTFLIKKGNNLIIDEIIQNGYSYNLKNNLGTISIKIVNKASYRINWPKSLEKKRQLEAKGIIVKDKNNVQGKHWLVKDKRNSFPAVKWRKTSKSKIPNIEYYTFKPTAKSTNLNGTFVSKMHEYISENPHVTLIYKR